MRSEDARDHKVFSGGKGGASIGFVEAKLRPEELRVIITQISYSLYFLHIKALVDDLKKLLGAQFGFHVEIVEDPPANGWALALGRDLARVF